MKNNIIRKSIICVTAVLLTTSCGKDILEPNVPGQVSVDEFYKTDEEAIQATTAVYDMMQAHYFPTAWNSIYLLKTLPSDEGNAGGSGPSDQPSYQQLDDFKHDSQTEVVLGVWKMCYYTINRANQVINQVKPENDLRKRLIAEAKALRAYNYLELVSLWGDVPLVLETLPPSEWTKVTRMPKAEIYAQIEKDLSEAIPVLPLKSEYGVMDKYRIAKGTAQAMLGKALLFQEKWEAAAIQFDEIIKSNQYSLEKDFGRVFSEAGEFGVESLFEISYTSQAMFNWGNFPWDNGRAIESNIHIQLMGPRGDYYKPAPKDSLIGGWGFNTPRSEIYNAFIQAGDEERRKHTLMSEAELKANGGDWTASSLWDYAGFIRRKYGTYVSQTSSANGDVPDLNYTTNWRLIRYADVLLMAAEAFYRSGNEGRALIELNKVRERAQLDPIQVTGNELFDAIVLERQLELAFEGFRYVDLVRWGKAAEVLGPLGFQANKHELMPIPSQDVITAGLTQNKGY